jgi:hypothetical protein
MENAHTFQHHIIRLDVGGHKFTTSLQTLTSVPDTYFASLFSGRFALTPNAEGAYFIDRDGSHFRHVLNYMREPVEEGYTLSSALEAHKEKLIEELELYGLLGRMMPTPRPYAAQELIGQSLLRRMLDGTKRELQVAMSQSRGLVFTIGTTTPFLSDEFQDLQFVITDRIVNRWPVWVAVGGKWFMHRSTGSETWITDDPNCASDDVSRCSVFYKKQNGDLSAPTEFPSNGWGIKASATLPAFASTVSELDEKTLLLHLGGGPLRRSAGGFWTHPNMRITAVHGLGDDDPAMAAARRQLAALA